MLTIKNAFKFDKEAMNWMLEAGFTFRKWVSNSTELEQMINAEGVITDSSIQGKELSCADQRVRSSDTGYKKVVDIRWNVDTEFIYNFDDIIVKADR